MSIRIVNRYTVNNEDDKPKLQKNQVGSTCYIKTTNSTYVFTSSLVWIRTSSTNSVVYSGSGVTDGELPAYSGITGPIITGSGVPIIRVLENTTNITVNAGNVTLNSTAITANAADILDLASKANVLSIENVAVDGHLISWSGVTGRHIRTTNIKSADLLLDADTLSTVTTTNKLITQDDLGLDGLHKQNLAGPYELDWANNRISTYKFNLTGNASLTEIGSPPIGASKLVTVYVEPNGFTFTVPGSWAITDPIGTARTQYVAEFIEIGDIWAVTTER